MRLFKRFFLLTITVFFVSPILAMEIPQRPANGIYNPSQLLPESEVASLWNAMSLFWHRTSINPWVYFVPMGVSIEPTEVLNAWSQKDASQSASQGDILVVVTQKGPRFFKSEIVVSQNLKEKFEEGELGIIAGQNIRAITSASSGEGPYFPDVSGTWTAVQNSLSGYHAVDTSVQGFLKKYIGEIRVAPWHQKIIGILFALAFILIIPLGLLFGKFTIGSGSGSGGGSGGASGGGGDFGGGGSSGKWGN